MEEVKGSSSKNTENKIKGSIDKKKIKKGTDTSKEPTIYKSKP